MLDLIRQMEVLLNTIWLLVAVGALLFWRPVKRFGAQKSRQSQSFGILALVCTLVLLFPVISLTDDLHAEQVAMEDSCRPLMKARNTVHGCLRSGRTLLMAGRPNAWISASVRHLISGAVVVVDVPVFSLTFVTAHDGRSPPAGV